MDHILSIAIILLFSLLGEILKTLIPLPIPANIYGMILLFLALKFKILKIEKINDVAQYLISIMLIFFIIPAVSIMDSFSLLKNNLFPILTVTIIPTILVIIVTGKTTEKIYHKKRKGKSDENVN